MSSYTRQQLEEWLKTITITGRVLDVGGCQKPVVNRVQKKGEVEIHTLDLEKPHENSGTPSFAHDLNEKLSTDKAIEQFDIVFCLEVMEYIWNPVQAIKNLARLTKKGGTLIISTPFLYPVHNPKQYDYLRYTPTGIRKILTECGFEVNEDFSKLRYMKNADFWNAFVSSEGMRPSKDYESHEAVGDLIGAKRI